MVHHHWEFHGIIVNCFILNETIGPSRSVLINMDWEQFSNRNFSLPYLRMLETEPRISCMISICFIIEEEFFPEEGPLLLAEGPFA